MKTFPSHRHPFRGIVCIWTLLLVAGCSVKENRSGCPCRLTFNFNYERNMAMNSLVLIVGCDGNVVHSDTIPRNDFETLYEVYVPKGVLSVTAVSVNGPDALMDDGSVVIPLGKECPEVFMDCFTIDASRCEAVNTDVILKKNYCRMTIRVEDEVNFGYDLDVRGGVDGYDAYGLCSAGDFLARASVVDEGEFLVLVPRQFDDSLLLDVSDGSDVLKTFALGEYIRASGFDWDAPELGDLVVGIDYARTVVSLSVAGWDKTYYFDFVI